MFGLIILICAKNHLIRTLANVLANLCCNRSCMCAKFQNDDSPLFKTNISTFHNFLHLFIPGKPTDALGEQGHVWNTEKHCNMRESCGFKEEKLKYKLMFAEIFICFQLIKTLCNASQLQSCKRYFFIPFKAFKHSFDLFSVSEYVTFCFNKRFVAHILHWAK